MKKAIRVNFKDDEYDIYIGRPSKWGNPFSHKRENIAEFQTKSRKESLVKYEEWLTKGDGKYLMDDLSELKGKKLGCWCKSNQKCHGDILIRLVNNLSKKGLESLFN